MTAGGGAPAVVVGAGIAGIACAGALADAGLDVRLIDRGRRIGGRMASRRYAERPVDTGASYVTARDPRFQAVVADWVERGLARPWTDTFHVATPEGLQGTRTGPLRYAAPAGLRSLVEDLAARLAPEYPSEVDAVEHDPVSGALRVDGSEASAVALCMPGPQALDLLPDHLADERAAAERTWEPALALVAHWPTRAWPALDGAFINESPVLTFVADDGRRRGDGAPVLVAHSDPVLAAAHLDDPLGAGPVMLAELQAALGIASAPDTWDVRRWSLAKPLASRDEPHHLGAAGIGLAGDGWHGPSRVEAAYLSGLTLGEALAARLTR
jgi:predicted NAD/FAD-dependent oxidoreductase